MITDTHAHLYDRAFQEDIDDVIARAKAAGVERLIIPGTKPEDAEPILELCKRYEFCRPALAIHPEDMDDDIEAQCERLADLFDRYKFVAVGECGIDLHWDKSRLDDQKKVLAFQIGLANERNLPLILHCRDAFAELAEVVEQNRSPQSAGVFHCFTGSVSDAKRIIDMGFYIGIGGVVTFRKSDVKNVIKEIGLDRVVLETDCPYLAPVPNRGKRNEPGYLRNVVDFLSVELDMDANYIEEITSNNARRLFNID